jgi:hypothetical protein
LIGLRARISELFVGLEFDAELLLLAVPVWGVTQGFSSLLSAHVFIDDAGKGDSTTNGTGLGNWWLGSRTRLWSVHSGRVHSIEP